ncbi:ribonuclease Z [Halalkalibacter akibai]|uniref:Ribonuclease Z n=1 Tax=Halalkalibacter akibai (strain ATCC 43226 / DSM 21942 / CIP 109018 / JCM 9157 / 1139) TaxID=1236973 RepID=W4QRR4_HALA3|nr:ribonuclease Z [Halalkalibacter akibai]GAE34617.1 ribonuclease Z [Halalkalibacter akibai JCM 9157]
MEFHFLGTGSGVPSTARNVSSLAVRFLQKKSTQWLFDCGEATQHQILKSPITLSKIDKIFISHLHGDHLFGLPGLLCSRSAQGAVTPLIIYGPIGTEQFVETALKVSKSYLSYDLSFIGVEEGIVYQDDSFLIEAIELDHVMPSFAFKITEADKPGSLKVEELVKLGIKPGPIFQKLKNGDEVLLEDGRKINGQQYITDKKKGRKIVIAGDTRPLQKMKDFAKEVDLLIHEGTFLAEKKEHANQFGHSTIADVAVLAKEANVKKLIINHISSRYAGDEELLEEEAKTIFNDSLIAFDFMVYKLMNNA